MKEKPFLVLHQEGERAKIPIMHRIKFNGKTLGCPEAKENTNDIPVSQVLVFKKKNYKLNANNAFIPPGIRRIIHRNSIHFKGIIH